MTYMQGKKFLEHEHRVTCSKKPIMHWTKSPFFSMESGAIDDYLAKREREGGTE